MSDDNLVDELLEQDRVLISAELHLANGSFFQPTGFPDIGACIYTDGAGRRRCLVESEQSMANRLEAVCMQAPGVWRPPMADRLPVIHVKDRKNRLLATNLTEAHRVASSYVLESDIKGVKSATLEKKLEEHLGIDGKTWPLDGRDRLAQAVFALDPAAILHGFQFMQWKAVGLRAARLLHARLEAALAGDGEVHYGLLKVDGIEPEMSSAQKSNKGQSIASKVRYVPQMSPDLATGDPCPAIQATFEIDVLSLRERSLVPASSEDGADHGSSNRAAQRFLLALALWKIHRFLTNGPAFDARTGDTMGALRLRADCSLALGRVSWAGSKQGAPFGGNEPLDPGRLVKLGATTEPAGLLEAPPNFEDLLKPFGLELDTTVTYGK